MRNGDFLMSEIDRVGGVRSESLKDVVIHVSSTAISSWPLSGVAIITTDNGPVKRAIAAAMAEAHMRRDARA